MPLRTLLGCLACLVSLLPAAVLHAQQLPQPGRTVFRCEVDGKVAYSDAPCKGAQKVDVEPTRRLSTTGRERPGADVQNERRREGIDQALQPVTGMGTEEMTVVRRRQRLAPAARAECGRLDKMTSSLERRELAAEGTARVAVQDELLVLRTRFLEVRC